MNTRAHASGIASARACGTTPARSSPIRTVPAITGRLVALAPQFQPLGAFRPGYDETVKYLNDYLAAHPSSENRWRILVMIGDAYLGKNDAAKARDYYSQAMAAAHDAAEREEVQDSINSMGAEGK